MLNNNPVYCIYEKHAIKDVSTGFALEQWSPAFLAPGTDFMEDSFSMDPVVEWFQDDSSVLQLLCILLLLHCDI